MRDLDFQNSAPVVRSQGTVPEPFTCHIYIYGPYIQVEVALGQNCQMYNKPAAQWGGLPYNNGNNERVNILLYTAVLALKE